MTSEEGDIMKLRYAIVVLAVLVAMARGCTPAGAQERPYDPTSPDCRHANERKGLLLGFSLGGGQGLLCFERPDGSEHEPDPERGGMGGLRVGVGVSNSVAFSVETHGFEREGNGSDWSAGVLVGAVTWWPQASGFFLRLGAGVGGVELEEPHPDGTVRELDRNGPAGFFALGYEWRVGRKFAVGVAAEAAGIDLDDTEDLKDLSFGHGGVTIQFNWYL
jgi:hypothetical protein